MSGELSSDPTMLPLGFRFDVDAIVLDGTAHRADCQLLPATLPADAVRLAACDTYRSERCPRECGCAPPFETLLSYKLEPAANPSAG
jgi:hypothetical protein